jgi:hypothetical protein
VNNKNEMYTVLDKMSESIGPHTENFYSLMRERERSIHTYILKIKNENQSDADEGAVQRLVC